MNNSNNLPKLFFSEWISSSNPHIDYSSAFTESKHIYQTQDQIDEEELMMINNNYSDVMLRTEFLQPDHEYANYYSSADFFINSDQNYV